MEDHMDLELEEVLGIVRLPKADSGTPTRKVEGSHSSGDYDDENSKKSMYSGEDE